MTTKRQLHQRRRRSKKFIGKRVLLFSIWTLISIDLLALNCSTYETAINRKQLKHSFMAWWQSNGKKWKNVRCQRATSPKSKKKTHQKNRAIENETTLMLLIPFMVHIICDDKCSINRTTFDGVIKIFWI